MIDLHCHILPSIDDGAPSTEVARDMFRTLAALGFSTVVATPHLDNWRDVAYLARVDQVRKETTPLADAQGMSLLQGYELRVGPDMPLRPGDGAALTLGRSTAMLADLPFVHWPYFADDMLTRVQAAGFRPVLAHPERYPRVQKDPALAEELVERGIVLQVTIGSFARAFGGRTQHTAEALLRLGTVQVAATDAHSTGERMAAVPAGLDRLRDMLGDEQLLLLTQAAPEALLTDATLPRPVRARTSTLRRWFSLPWRR